MLIMIWGRCSGREQEEREKERERETWTQRDGQACDKEVTPLIPVVPRPVSPYLRRRAGWAFPALGMSSVQSQGRVLSVWAASPGPLSLSPSSDVACGVQGPLWVLGWPVHTGGASPSPPSHTRVCLTSFSNGLPPGGSDWAKEAGAPSSRKCFVGYLHHGRALCADTSVVSDSLRPPGL